MDFDQGVVKFFLRWLKKTRQQNLEAKKQEYFSASLSKSKESLVYFASAVFGKPIEIRETEDYPYVSGLKLFLPPFFAIANSQEKNAEAYRLLVLNLFAISLLYKPSKVVGPLENDLVLIEKLIPQAKNTLGLMFPRYIETLNEILSSCLPSESSPKIFSVGFDRRAIWGRLPRLSIIIESFSVEAEKREALPQGTERKSKSKGKIKKIELEEKENLGEDVFHSFEKIETAEEYKGVKRGTDGEDELAQHAEALDDLNIEEVIRSSKSVKSLYKTDLDMGFEISDLVDPADTSTSEKIFFYDEWDERKRIYKKDWCRVLHSCEDFTKKGASVKKSLSACLDSHSNEIKILKKRLIQLASEVRVEKRLLKGRTVDIDNVIRNYCLRKSGASGDQRFYQETKKRHRDLACLLLVDTSLSSDAWIQNRRILDTSLEALLIFGEAAASLKDPTMVAGFHSNTRHDCRFIEWKSFEDPWSRFRLNVDNIEPAGYTRIGPALRHATELLSKRPEKHKLLLVFTDGRPTDFDRYEGSYGLGDVRQAVREADRSGITSFALALDPSAKQFLPLLFGMGNFQILNNVESLPVALTKLYAKMAKSSV